MLDSELSQTYRIIAPDLPGHGQSVKAASPDQTYHLQGMAHGVMKLMRELTLEPTSTIVIGYSLGGHIGIQLLDLLPEIAGLLVQGTPPLSLPLPIQEAFLPFPGLGLLFTGEVAPDQVEVLRQFHYLGSGDQTVADYLATDPRFRLEIGQSIAQQSHMKDEIEILRQWNKPVWLLCGDADVVVDKAYLLKVSDLLPVVHTVFLPAAGHAALSDQPELYVDRVQQYLKVLWS